MDKALKADIVRTVELTMRQVLEGSDERWLTGEQLIAQFGFFTKDWLKRYGHLLPRDRFEVVDTNGNRHASRWAYPQHKIQRWIQERKNKNLTLTHTQ